MELSDAISFVVLQQEISERVCVRVIQIDEVRVDRFDPALSHEWCNLEGLQTSVMTHHDHASSLIGLLQCLHVVRNCEVAHVHRVEAQLGNPESQSLC